MISTSGYNYTHDKKHQKISYPYTESFGLVFITLMSLIKDKSIVGRSLILFLLATLFLMNFLLPVYLWIKFNKSLDAVNFWYFDISYAYVAVSYMAIALCIWIEKENLENFHIDRASVIFFILSALYFFRHKYSVPNEAFFLLIISISGLFALITLIKNWTQTPKTNLQWLIIGILVTGIILIPANYFDYADNYASGNTKFDLIQWIISSFVYNLSFASVIEEFIFRGFLWGYLTKIGWSERKIFFVQAILFWSMHISKVPSLLVVLILLPLVTLIYSLLAKYSKQIFPSIVSHTLYNMFVSIFWRILKF